MGRVERRGGTRLLHVKSAAKTYGQKKSEKARKSESGSCKRHGRTVDVRAMLHARQAVNEDDSALRRVLMAKAPRDAASRCGFEV